MKSGCSHVEGLLTWPESLDYCDLQAVVMHSFQPSIGPCLWKVVVPHLLWFWKCFSVSLDKALAFVWQQKLIQESHLVKVFPLSTLFHSPLSLVFYLFSLFSCFALPWLSFSARPVTWCSSPCTCMGSYTKTRDTSTSKCLVMWRLAGPSHSALA